MTPLTPADLAAIEARAKEAGDVLNNIGWRKDVLAVLRDDLPRLLAHCRSLLPLLDALASGEADQYRAGRDAGLEEAAGVAEDWHEAVVMMRDVKLHEFRKKHGHDGPVGDTIRSLKGN